jgi:hypothetical protein
MPAGTAIPLLKRAALLVAVFAAVGCNASVPSSSPVASATPSPAADDPTPVPPGPTATPGEAGEFVPPAPVCPSPAGPVEPPDVLVSVGDGPGIIATRGPSTLLTCTISSASDVVSSEPPAGIAAAPGDLLTLSLPAGWRFLHWEGFDRPSGGEGGNVWPGVDTPDRPGRINVPVPARNGVSIAGYTLWVISDDGRVVGQVEIVIQVTIN